MLSRRQLFTAAGVAALASAGLPAGAAAVAAPGGVWSGEIQVGEWERYYLGLDGGAHQVALGAFGIPHTDGVHADEQYRMVPVESVRRAAVEFGDHAAADVVRARLGLGSPSMLGLGLELVLGQRGLEERYLDDPALQLRYLGLRRRFADHVMPMHPAVRAALA